MALQICHNRLISRSLLFQNISRKDYLRINLFKAFIFLVSIQQNIKNLNIFYYGSQPNVYFKDNIK